MVVEVYLDDILLKDEPEGVRKMQEIISNDDTLHGYVVRYNQISLTFFGDGYNYIREQIRLNGYEKRVAVKFIVKDGSGYTDRIDAFFFTTDTVLNATKNTYEVRLENNNFGAFLKSGAKEKITPSATKSRNNEDITPITEDSVTIFTPSTGANLTTGAKMFRITDVLELIVAYLSDNSLSFSDSSTALSGLIKYGLTKHYYIQTRGDVPNNQVSFKEVMDFIWKAFNIKFWVDTEPETPVFYIAEEDTLMEEPDGSILFEDIKDLEVSFNQDLMFSTIKLGSSKENIDIGGSVYSLPFSPLIGFGEENVNARSTSMIDNELDLSFSRFLCGTNKIEELLTSTSYIEDNIIIQYLSFPTKAASKGTYGKSGVSRLYNENLLNKNVVENHNLPTQMVSEIALDTDNFKAFITTDTAVPFSTYPIIFNDDSVLGFDTGGNYDNATGLYTVPDTGTFVFGMDFWLHTTSLSSTYIEQNGVSIVVDFYRNGSSVYSDTFVILGTQENPVKKSASYTGYFESGDTVGVLITTAFLYTGITGTNSAVIKGEFIHVPDDTTIPSYATATNFNTQFIFNSGGAVVTPDTTDYPAVLYDFPYGIDLKTWKSLRNRPIQGVYVNTNNRNKSKAWVKEISRTWITGESEVTLFTKLSENKI